MRAYGYVLGMALMASAALAGCSAMTGGSQTVDVTVKGAPTAFCQFSTSTMRHSGTYPDKLTLDRSGEPLQVECRDDKNLYKKFEVTPTSEPAAAGGFLAGIGATNATSFAYPNPIVIDFEAIDDAAAIPAQPVEAVEASVVEHMQPVVDDNAAAAPVAKKAKKGKAAKHADKHVAAKPIVDEKTASSEAPSGKGQMQPVASPEDKMGANPKKVKAEAAAKAKAKEEAKRKAKEEAAAKKAAAAEAKAQAAAAAAATTTPAAPIDAVTTPATAAPAATTATPATVAPATAAPAATLPVDPALAPAEPVAPAAAPTSSAAPAAGTEKIDADKYLTGKAQ